MILLYRAEFPFEFRALEVALEAICSFLDARTRELETDAYPALDELTSKASLSLILFVCLFSVGIDERINLSFEGVLYYDVCLEYACRKLAFPFLFFIYG